MDMEKAYEEIMRNKIAMHIALFLTSFTLASSYPAYAIYGLKDDRIHFAVVRFTPIDLWINGEFNENIGIDYVTVESYAVFSQPYNLSVQDSVYADFGTYFYKYVDEFQSSWFSLRSRFTGGDFFQLHVGQRWPYVPAEGEFRSDINITFDGVHPDTIIEVENTRIQNYFKVPAKDLWEKVKHTNIPNKVALNGRFDVYGFTSEHSAAPELYRYLILQNVPELPEVIIIAGMERPLDMMTANVPVTPEVRLLNRGHEPAGANLHLEITDGYSILYSDEAASGAVAPESFGSVEFEPFTHPRSDSLEFRFSLTAGAPAESAWTRSVEVVADPVFRGRSWWDKAGGKYMPAARLYGPDKDGVYDIITRKEGWDLPKYFGNEGDGVFQNRTIEFTPEQLQEKWEDGSEYKLRTWTYGDINNDGLIDSVTTLTYPPEVYLRQEWGGFYLEPGVFGSMSGARSAVIFDYNQDGINDILFMGFSPIVLLRGEGDLEFTDVTSEVGPLPRALLGDAGDLNGDGYPDMVLIYYYEIFLLMNQGGKSFADRSHLLTTRHKYIGFEIRSTDYYMGIIDMDGDGDNDIFGEHFYFANLGFNPIPTGIKAEQKNPAIPSTYNLHPSYPNPFNPKTTIRFDLPEAGNVRIVIYNILGQQVAELVNGDLPAGNHERVWDATRFGSGIYLVRMEAAGYSKTIKTTLVK